ncbi:hypothetical protein [Couchioplanes caeruleus]|uniref:TetR family transcriptional regulator n=2 Tax=Couchioplanes caeruleus TaxID=56438 RepID=A0A1K0GL54_9ACTN|nr:hypothetical protein [Couchioplanes caeruleus]OJF13030.1 hypothetical protein BG844_17380 [Couchioplanes caeruleus subsp. caeruleus]ROP34093.1 hypothetical protein EDD30_7161 [Couchioplanes caeruleus]
MTLGKKDLPFPYNQDFSGIVTRVKGVREATRAALVNSPKVASYLKAGANLVEQNLGACAEPPAADGRKQYWSGLRFLTERALSREMENLEPPFLRQKGDGPYRATWATHDDYLNDLLTFLFHAMNYDPQYNAEVETRGWLDDEESFVDAIDRATFHELQAICRMPLFRLQLIMVATADRNDGIHEAISNNYAGALEPWKKIYESTFASRGFQLRPGVTLDQLAYMLAAVTEGFALHHLGDPGAGIVGDDPDDNLVGMAVLAILAGYLEPVAEPTGSTLREQFRSVSNRARPADRTIEHRGE